MKNIIRLSALAISISFLLLSACNNPKTDEEIKKLALSIHESVLTIDTHNDTPMRLDNPDFNIGESHDSHKGGGKVDFPRMKQGGEDGTFFAVFIGQGKRDKEGNQKAYNKAIKTFNNIYDALDKHSDLAGLATTPKDAYDLEKEGKRAIFIGIENGYLIGNDLSRVEEFYDLGARYITLCHTKNNDICDSSTDKNGPEYGGLSPFGEKVVKEMNRLGIMVDISHVSDESFYDAIKLSKAPIIASHSSSRAICDSPRNLTDDMLLALADNGGVIQICILSSYLKKQKPNPERDSAYAALWTKYDQIAKDDSIGRAALSQERRDIRKKYPTQMATVKDAVDHIDHIVDLIGIDHVGIGTDFDGGGGIEGCYDVTEMPNITIELVKRGYSKKDIRKIWGGNIMRVLQEVEDIAATQ